MAVTLNASTTTGLVQSADTSGVIELQNNGTTRLTVNSSGTTIPTATVTTLNTPSGVLATQNGMTGIAKAWVSWDGNNGTRYGSFNVSSVTRNSTANYTINFTNAMPDVNYAWSGSAGCLGVNQTPYVSAPNGVALNTWKTTTTLTVVGIFQNNTNNGDTENASFSVIVLSS